MGALISSGWVVIGSLKFICNNIATILESSRGLTMSVFHRTKSDYDIIATIKYLEKEWYNNVEVTYQWVKGYVDRLKRPLIKK
jgi:hypothetical protein